MCIELHIPLDSIYNMTDEDYIGLVEESHIMSGEAESKMSGKSHTRQPNSKELVLYNKMKKGK